jgi:flagellar basal-body rod protein FlgB
VIASNIANADTPGYQARDFDFAPPCAPPPAGQQRLPASPARRDEPHRPPQRPRCATPAAQTNLDRNTVDMDRERASFADNASSTKPRCASSTAACERCSMP